MTAFWHSLDRPPPPNTGADEARRKQALEELELFHADHEAIQLVAAERGITVPEAWALAQSEGREKQREQAAEDQRRRQSGEGSPAAPLRGEHQPDEAGAEQPAEDEEADEEGVEVDGVQGSLRL